MLKNQGVQKRVQNKPWFTAECTEFKKRYYAARSKFRHYKCISSRERMKNAGKSYKAVARKAKMQYKLSYNETLTLLSKKNPKKFWQIIQGHRKAENKYIDKKKLFDHFEALNTVQNNALDTHNVPPASVSFHDENHSSIASTLLNWNFTEYEVLHCINKLSTGKASGHDGIVNDYIKCTKNVMLPVYTTLFNIALNTGLVPSSWCLAVIKPLYKNKGSRTLPENYRGISLLSCIGKLFTAVVNSRIEQYLNIWHKMGPEQARF